MMNNEHLDFNINNEHNQSNIYNQHIKSYKFSEDRKKFIIKEALNFKFQPISEEKYSQSHSQSKENIIKEENFSNFHMKSIKTKVGKRQKNEKSKESKWKSQKNESNKLTEVESKKKMFYSINEVILEEKNKMLLKEEKENMKKNTTMKYMNTIKKSTSKKYNNFIKIEFEKQEKIVKELEDQIIKEREERLKLVQNFNKRLNFISKPNDTKRKCSNNKSKTRCKSKEVIKKRIVNYKNQSLYKKDKGKLINNHNNSIINRNIKRDDDISSKERREEKKSEEEGKSNKAESRFDYKNNHENQSLLFKIMNNIDNYLLETSENQKDHNKIELKSQYNQSISLKNDTKSITTYKSDDQLTSLIETIIEDLIVDEIVILNKIENKNKNKEVLAYKQTLISKYITDIHELNIIEKEIELKLKNDYKVKYVYEKIPDRKDIFYMTDEKGYKNSCFFIKKQRFMLRLSKKSCENILDYKDLYVKHIKESIYYMSKYGIYSINQVERLESQIVIELVDDIINNLCEQTENHIDEITVSVLKQEVNT